MLALGTGMGSVYLTLYPQQGFVKNSRIKNNSSDILLVRGFLRNLLKIQIIIQATMQAVTAAP